MKFTNKTYDVLKFIAQVLLPAVGTLYFAVAGIWNLPDAEKIVGTITAVDTFLGVVLAISSSGYKPPADGRLVVDTSDPNKDVYALEVHTPVDELASKKAITLHVAQADTPNVRVMPLWA